MKEYEIWIEGYAIQGNSGKAQLLGKYMADSWDDAVKKYMADNPNEITIGQDGYSDWGCRLFDNETDARKSFG